MACLVRASTMLDTPITLVSAWFAGGGPLLPVMVAMSLILYAAICERIIDLYRRQPTAVLDPIELSRGMALIRALIVAMPLMGLLGTVHGIVAVFAGLGGPDPTRTSSAGIGQALLTTQYGICVAVPAMIGEWVLRRRIDELQLPGSPS